MRLGREIVVAGLPPLVPQMSVPCHSLNYKNRMLGTDLHYFFFHLKSSIPVFQRRQINITEKKHAFKKRKLRTKSDFAYKIRIAKFFKIILKGYHFLTVKQKNWISNVSLLHLYNAFTQKCIFILSNIIIYFQKKKPVRFSLMCCRVG